MLNTLGAEGGKFMARQTEVNQPIFNTVGNITDTIGRKDNCIETETEKVLSKVASCLQSKISSTDLISSWIFLFGSQGQIFHRNNNNIEKILFEFAIIFLSVFRALSIYLPS